ncbi:sigma 54-interacting transcriptional regulator [Pyxidicoccus parkwayensis]|uniref:Sigma 54-interacting transcriptional regulator n=1 Tax=Pyxidicoccus parkwayensis TaxID=2813578 RepID=A0ABX7P090_9BACT|nr:sigma 54-interacting transcriptional regulator [Pyxidicoccus parkwaysis]QSQ24148.1 sigma 54-interacting transcriptional regulator [Pyxidicoccus parkwaysis]
MFGPCRGVARELDAPLVVGRASEGGLQLLDEKVSREHCVFSPDGDGHSLKDLGSRNGTWLNGQRIPAQQAMALRPGDHVSVGESVLVYEPSFEALRARDGESTLVLTRTRAERARSSSAPGPDALARAGELALRAATTPSPDAAVGLVFEALESALQPSALVMLRLGPHGPRPRHTRPHGAHLTVSRELVDSALRAGRALVMPEPQARAEHDAHTTRVRRSDAHVLCAPLYSAGQPAGALCILREQAFQDEELSLAGALALAVGPSLCPPEPPSTSGHPSPVAESASMREAMRVAAAAAAVQSTVLITGESGTGKEEVARSLHALGPRTKGPFIAVNCGAIPAELAESELFGHEKGAFTGAQSLREGVFEQADGGTLFLDEVGDLPAPLQVKLLRVLQDRIVHRVGGRSGVPVDVRVVAATHRDLKEAVRTGSFREDLYWRLNVVRIHLAPLRERPEDVLPLAERFLAKLGPQLGRRAAGFTREASNALRVCPWPGNVRQLANAIERALVLKGPGDHVGVDDLPPEVASPERHGSTEGLSGSERLGGSERTDGPKHLGGPERPGGIERPGSQASASGTPSPAGGVQATLAEVLKAVEREHIVLALKRARGVKSAAAEALGISRPTLDRKLEEYGIDLYA